MTICKWCGTVPKRKCAECGKGFSPARCDQKFCSAACRLKNHRKKKESEK